MTDAGEVLESVRILNDVESLDRVIARAGEDPEVVLEATYGWYWAVDAPSGWCERASGASVGGEGVRVPAGEERHTLWDAVKVAARAATGNRYGSERTRFSWDNVTAEPLARTERHPAKNPGGVMRRDHRDSPSRRLINRGILA
jgi:hypothetical protein